MVFDFYTRYNCPQKTSVKMGRFGIFQYCLVIFLLPCLRAIKTGIPSNRQLVKDDARDSNVIIVHSAGDRVRVQSERPGTRNPAEDLPISHQLLNAPDALRRTTGVKVTANVPLDLLNFSQIGFFNERRRRSADDDDPQPESTNDRRVRGRGRRRNTSSDYRTKRRRVSLRLAREEDSVPDDIQKIRVVQMKKSIDKQADDSKSGVAVASVVIRHKTLQPQRSNDSLDRETNSTENERLPHISVDTDSGKRLEENELNQSQVIRINKKIILQENIPTKHSSNRYTRRRNNRVELKRKSITKTTESSLVGINELAESSSLESHSVLSQKQPPAPRRRQSKLFKNGRSRSRYPVNRSKNQSQEPRNQNQRIRPTIEKEIDSKGDSEKENTTTKSSTVKPSKLEASTKPKIRKKIGRIRVVPPSIATDKVTERQPRVLSPVKPNGNFIESLNNEAESNADSSNQKIIKSKPLSSSSSDEITIRNSSSESADRTTRKRQSIKSRYQNRLRFPSRLSRSKQKYPSTEQITETPQTSQLPNKQNFEEDTRVKDMNRNVSSGRLRSNRFGPDHIRKVKVRTRKIPSNSIKVNESNIVSENQLIEIEEKTESSISNFRSIKQNAKKGNISSSFFLPSIPRDPRRLNANKILPSKTITEDSVSSTQVSVTRRKGVVFPRRLYNVFKKSKEEDKSLTHRKNKTENIIGTSHNTTQHENQVHNVIGGAAQIKTTEIPSLRRKHNLVAPSRPLTYNANRRKDNRLPFPFLFPTRKSTSTPVTIIINNDQLLSTDENSQENIEAESTTDSKQLVGRGDSTTTTERYTSSPTLDDSTQSKHSEPSTPDDSDLETTTSRARKRYSLYPWLNKSQNKSRRSRYSTSDGQAVRFSLPTRTTSTPLYEDEEEENITTQQSTTEIRTTETIKKLSTFQNNDDGRTNTNRNFNPLYQSVFQKSSGKMAENIAKLRARLQSDKTDIRISEQKQNLTTESPSESAGAIGSERSIDVNVDRSGIRARNDQLFNLHNDTKYPSLNKKRLEETAYPSSTHIYENIRDKDYTEVIPWNTESYSTSSTIGTDWSQWPLTTQSLPDVDETSTSTPSFDDSISTTQPEEPTAFTDSVETKLFNSLTTDKPISSSYSSEPFQVLSSDHSRSGRGRLLDVVNYRDKGHRSNLRSLVELLKVSIDKYRTTSQPLTYNVSTINTDSDTDTLYTYESTESSEEFRLLTSVSPLSPNKIEASQPTAKDSPSKVCQPSKGDICLEIAPVNDVKQHENHSVKSVSEIVENKNVMRRPEIDQQYFNKSIENKFENISGTGRGLVDEHGETVEKKINEIKLENDHESTTVESVVLDDEAKTTTPIITTPVNLKITSDSAKYSTYGAITTTEDGTITTSQTSVSSVDKTAKTPTEEEESTTAKTSTTETSTSTVEKEDEDGKTSSALWMETATLSNLMVESIYADSTEGFSDVNSIVEALFELTTQSSRSDPKILIRFDNTSDVTEVNSTAKSQSKIENQSDTNLNTVPDEIEMYSRRFYIVEGITMDSTSSSSIITTPNDSTEKSTIISLNSDHETSKDSTEKSTITSLPIDHGMSKNKNEMVNHEIKPTSGAAEEYEYFESQVSARRSPTPNDSRFTIRATKSKNLVSDSLTADMDSISDEDTVYDITSTQQSTSVVDNETTIYDKEKDNSLNTDSPNTVDINFYGVIDERKNSNDDTVEIAFRSSKRAQSNETSSSLNETKSEVVTIDARARGKEPLFDDNSILAYATVTPRYRNPDSLFKGKTYQSSVGTNTAKYTIVSAAVISLLTRYYL